MSTYLFKIKLEGSSKPPIWRKIRVPSRSNFDDFHIIIQVAFGWTNSHMYSFSPKGYGSYPNIRYNYGDDIDDFYTLTEPEFFPYGDYFDASSVMISDYFKTKGQKMTYIYDFGDDWIHSIELIEISDESVLRPNCVSGKANTPIEDCGGIHGYYHLIDIINDPQHPDHHEWREWMGLEQGESWDINEFDLDGTNEILHKVWDKLIDMKKNI